MALQNAQSTAQDSRRSLDMIFSLIGVGASGDDASAHPSVLPPPIDVGVAGHRSRDSAGSAAELLSPPASLSGKEPPGHRGHGRSGSFQPLLASSGSVGAGHASTSTTGATMAMLSTPTTITSTDITGGSAGDGDSLGDDAPAPWSHRVSAGRHDHGDPPHPTQQQQQQQQLTSVVVEEQEHGAADRAGYVEVFSPPLHHDRPPPAHRCTGPGRPRGGAGRPSEAAVGLGLGMGAASHAHLTKGFSNNPLISSGPHLDAPSRAAVLSARAAAMAREKELCEASRQAAREALVAEHHSTFLGLLHFLAFSMVLSAGYGVYRTCFCDFFLHWQNNVKPFQKHWGDVFSLLTIGGTVFATGPTLRGFHWSLQLLCLPVYFGAVIAFGAIGEVKMLHNSLNSTSSWDPPAVYVYGPAIALIAALIVYSFARSRTWWELLTSVTIICVIGGAYASAVITGLAVKIPFERLRFQPHHYQLAWTVCLMFRHPTDPVSLVIRWVFLGIMTHGLSAYGVAPIFGGRWSTSCISIA